MITEYHVHIYYTEKSEAFAARLQKLADEKFGSRMRVTGLWGRAVGPHPVPMFELDFAPRDLEEVLSWVLLHRGELSVLLHPVTGDDLVDHRDHAIWIGTQLPLNLEAL